MKRLASKNLFNITNEVKDEEIIAKLTGEPKKVFRKYYKSQQFDNSQLSEILKALESNLSLDKVEIMADPRFNQDQMDAILWGFIEGLTTEQVKLFAKPEINYQEMVQMRKDLKSLNIEEVKNKYQVARKLAKRKAKRLNNRDNKIENRLKKKAENINVYDDTEIGIDIDNLSQMQPLKQLAEADVKHDRCPVCKYKQLQKQEGYKICPRCNTIYKLYDGKAYIVS